MNRKHTFLAALCLWFLPCFILTGQVHPEINDPLAHTFSIVARDPVTGEMAVGVQSHWFSVGTIVSWGTSGVGVVATQSFVNPAYGPEGLKLMAQGKTAGVALKMLVDHPDTACQSVFGGMKNDPIAVHKNFSGIMLVKSRENAH